MAPRNKLLATIEDWRAKLLDLTKRNRLINCRIGPKAAVELLHPSPEQVWELLVNREATLSFALKAKLVDAQRLLKVAESHSQASAPSALGIGVS